MKRTVVLFLVFLKVQSELICSHQPIIALAGYDVTLPCHLVPAINAAFLKVEWTKTGLDPKYVHVHKAGRLLFEDQNPSYYYRTRVFVDELVRGNVSMKIFRVQISDAGQYWCFLPAIKKEAFIELVVGSVSTPDIKVISNNSEEVVLQCESTGWYPEPEVLWLDAEGNLLSAGPTETVRGPDDLYNVSSRVTVEKRHSNNFTCRVQQRNINQTRETQIHVPGGFMVSMAPPRHRIFSSVFIIIVILFSVAFINVSVKRNKQTNVQKTKL